MIMKGLDFRINIRGSATYALIGSLVSIIFFGLLYITFDNIVQKQLVDAAIATGTALPDDVVTFWSITIPMMFIFAVLLFAIKNAQRGQN